MKMKLKCFLCGLLGVKRITEERLRAIGFVDSGDDRGLDMLVKNDVEVWFFNNDDYWLVDMLDQVGIDKGFVYMHELEMFFTACGLDMKSPPHQN